MSEKKTKEGGEVSLTPPPGLAGVMSLASGIVSAAALGGQHDDTVVPSEAAAQSQQPSAVQLSTDLDAQHSMLAQGRGAESSPSAAPSQAFPVVGATRSLARSKEGEYAMIFENLRPLEDGLVVRRGGATILGKKALMYTGMGVVLIHQVGGGAPLVPNSPGGKKLAQPAFVAYLTAKSRAGTELRDNLNKSVQQLGVPPTVFNIANVDIDASRAGTPYASVIFVCRDAQVGHKLLTWAFDNLPPIKGTNFEVLRDGSPVPEEVVLSTFVIDRAATGIAAAGGLEIFLNSLFNMDAILGDSTFAFDGKNTDRATFSITHKPLDDPVAGAVPRTGRSVIRVGTTTNSVSVGVRNTKYWAPCPCGSSLHFKSNCPLKPAAAPPMAAPVGPKPIGVPPRRLHPQPLAPAPAILEEMKKRDSMLPPPPTGPAPTPASALPASSPLPQRAVNPSSAPLHVMPPTSAHLPPSQDPPVVVIPALLDQYIEDARSIPSKRGGRGGHTPAPSHRAASLKRLLATAEQMPQGAELRAAVFTPAFLLPGQPEMRAFLSDAIRGISDPDLKLYNLTEEFIKIVMNIRDVEYTPPMCSEGFTMVDSNKKGSKKRVASDSSASDDAAAGGGAATGAAASTTSSPPAKRAARKAGGAAADSDTSDDEMSVAAGPPLNGHYDDHNDD